MQRHLGPLVDQERLILRFPDKVRSRNQAYRTNPEKWPAPEVAWRGSPTGLDGRFIPAEQKAARARRTRHDGGWGCDGRGAERRAWQSGVPRSRLARFPGGM